MYIVQAIEYYMEISIDNLWQTISERNLIQGIGHYIEISIDSLWQRISETILSKIDTLWQRNLKQFWSTQAVERHLKILIEPLGLRISKTFVQTIGYYMEISIGFFFWQRISESIMAESILSKQFSITWKFPYTTCGEQFLKEL